MRLNDPHGAEAGLAHETAAWLRPNRYYALWRHAIQYLTECNPEPRKK
jgi:hypothetical protein